MSLKSSEISAINLLKHAFCSFLSSLLSVQLQWHKYLFTFFHFFFFLTGSYYVGRLSLNLQSSWPCLPGTGIAVMCYHTQLWVQIFSFFFFPPLPQLGKFSDLSLNFFFCLNLSNCGSQLCVYFLQCHSFNYSATRLLFGPFIWYLLNFHSDHKLFSRLHETVYLSSIVSYCTSLRWLFWITFLPFCKFPFL
jgi:hypothetical protein